MEWDKMLKLLNAKTERQCPEMADGGRRRR
jgi:hypothetical protein